MSFLLDTNICITLLKGTDQFLTEKFQSQNPNDLVLCSVVKAELLYGARKSQMVDANLALLDKFFSQFDCVPFDDKAAEFYGITRALLTRAGTPIGANDLLIAGIAQAHDHVLVSRNQSEFSRVPNLRLEVW